MDRPVVLVGVVSRLVINFPWVARQAGVGLFVVMAVAVAVVAATIVYRWAAEHISRPWKRLLRAVDFEENCLAITIADPHMGVEQAWRLHARMRVYAGRPARRFRTASAMVDGVVGTSLANAGQWEDAVAHLLPAITALRGVCGAEPILVRFLQDAGWAQQHLDDYESAMALVDESLRLLRPLGLHRWRTPDYYRGLRQRIGLLRAMRRFDEAIRMSAEALSAARSRPGDETMIGTLLDEHANTLLAAGHIAEAVDAASVAVQRVRRLDSPKDLRDAVSTFGSALMLAERHDEAIQALREAADLSEGLAIRTPARYGAVATLDRLLYAQALYRAGRTAEASDVLTPAEDAITDTATDFLAQQNRALFALLRAQILERQGRPTEALAAARLAEERLVRINDLQPGGWFDREFADVRALRDRLEDLQRPIEEIPA